MIHSTPFKIEFYKGDALVAVVNARNLFEFEHFRKKKEEGWVTVIFKLILSFKNKLLSDEIKLSQ